MLESYSSMKPFEVRCRWWRPDSPENRVSGSVGFNGSEIVAVLDEWIGNEAPMSFPAIDSLHAEAIDGAAITVFDTFVSRYGSEIELVVNSMGVGAHLAPLSQQKFTDAKALINGLDDWRGCDQFEISSEAGGGTLIECAAPSGIPISVPDRSASITLGQSQQQIGGGRRIEVVYESFLHFTPNAPQKADWFHGIIQEMRQLLTLFLNQDAALLGMSLTPLNLDEFGFENPVQWFWNRRDAEVQEISRTKILLSLADVEDRLEDVFRKWLSKAEDLRRSRALLFANEAAPAQFMESRFLPIVQALEVYCRLLGSEKYIPESEYRELKKKIFEIVPVGLSDGLEQKLRTSIGFSNEISLNDRILKLLNSLEQDTCRFVCQDAEKFTRWLRDSRNYYTHYSGSKEKALTGNALYWATEQASLLLKILMLKECDIPESLIQERLRQSGHHQQGMQIWAEIEKEL